METRDIIAKNLIAYRKQAKLTQQELADQLNYSDKAISKWERAEAIPDILVLKQIADCYGITLNDIINDSNTLVPPPLVESTRRRNIRHILIAMLSVGLIFLIATIVTVVCGLLDMGIGSKAYIISLPISSIVLLVFSCIWGKIYMRAISTSAIVWTLCICLSQLVLHSIDTNWLVYLIGASLQILIILWFVLIYVNTTKRVLTKQKKKSNTKK